MVQTRLQLKRQKQAEKQERRRECLDAILVVLNEKFPETNFESKEKWVDVIKQFINLGKNGDHQRKLSVHSDSSNSDVEVQPVLRRLGLDKLDRTPTIKEAPSRYNLRREGNPRQREVSNQLDRLAEEGYTDEKDSVIKPTPEAVEQARKALAAWFKHKDAQDLPPPSVAIGTDDSSIFIEWEKGHQHVACYFRGNWPVEVAFSDARAMKTSLLDSKTVEELMCTVANQVREIFEGIVTE